MKLVKCVFCDHVWEPRDHVIHHIVDEHLEKVPAILRNQLLQWYSDKEDEVNGC